MRRPIAKFSKTFENELNMSILVTFAEKETLCFGRIFLTCHQGRIFCIELRKFFSVETEWKRIRVHKDIASC